MAKNRSMAIKHTKAKKCAMKEVLENAKIEMCCKTIPNNVHCSDIPYSTSNVFFSKFAIQKRIDLLVGGHYPADDFMRNWAEIYNYLITHTASNAKEYFSDKISMIKEDCIMKGK